MPDETENTFNIFYKIVAKSNTHCIVVQMVRCKTNHLPVFGIFLLV